MANLGSDNTPVKGENFSLPAGAQIDEDDGDLVVRDSGGSIVLRRDEGAGTWDFVSGDLTGIASLEADTLGISGNSHIPIAGATARNELDETSSSDYVSVGTFAGSPFDVSEIPDNASLFANFQVRGSADAGEIMDVRPDLYSPVENASVSLDELELSFDDSLSTQSSGWTEITKNLSDSLYRPWRIETKVSGGTSGPGNRVLILFAWRFD